MSRARRGKWRPRWVREYGGWIVFDTVALGALWYTAGPVPVVLAFIVAAVLAAVPSRQPMRRARRP